MVQIILRRFRKYEIMGGYYIRSSQLFLFFVFYPFCILRGLEILENEVTQSTVFDYFP